MSSTPKYLICPDCGNTLSEKTDANGHVYHCGRCGYRRDG